MNASDKQDTQGAPRRIFVRHGALHHAETRRLRVRDALPVLLLTLVVFSAAAVLGGPWLARHLPESMCAAGADMMRHIAALRGVEAEKVETLPLESSGAEAGAAPLDEAGLTPEQRAELRRYEDCVERIERLRVAVMRENGAKSPHFARAVAATRAFREKRAVYDRLDAKTLSLDERKTWTQEMARLRTEAAEANAAHRAWKEAHAGELRRLEDDADYRRLQEELRTYEARLPAGFAHRKPAAEERVFL